MSDWNAAINEAADKIPTNWLDPLLSGPNKIDVANMSPISAVEKVLLALQQRILSLKRPAPLDGGWKLVPVETTQEIIEAGIAALGEDDDRSAACLVSDVYRAVVKAAPSPEKAEGER